MPNPEVTVVIPCLDEAVAIERCIESALAAFAESGIAGEVVVADNGSLDGSPAIAAAAGARVVHEARRGYGSALRAGFAAARGEYIVMADADLTYDFADVPKFVEHLRDGADMVMGDRMKNIEPGAMPFLHRYVGNPVLTGVLNLFFKTGVSDAHCGMRGFRREVLQRLDLRTTGMELASEMVIRAGQENLRIDEFPIRYSPREGESKLSTLTDGWRHLRFLLVHSPTWLFMVPAALLASVGLLTGVTVLAGIPVFGRTWQTHSLVASSMLLVVGTQIAGLGFSAHAYGAYFLGRRVPWFDRMRDRLRLEHALLAGVGLLLAGLAAALVVVGIWVGNGLGELRQMPLFIVAATMVMLGAQVVFNAFLISILGLRRRSGPSEVLSLENVERFDDVSVPADGDPDRLPALARGAASDL